MRISYMRVYIKGNEGGHPPNKLFLPSVLVFVHIHDSMGLDNSIFE